MKNFTKLFLIIWVLSTQLLLGQEKNYVVNVASPNAASFQIFGDVPVSLYTGLPQISIPIHTIQTNEISVPISLDYHAAGFKPDVHPSWVGLSWNLNAGGVITRIVKVGPDDFEAFSSDIRPDGFYYSYRTLSWESWSNYRNPSNLDPIRNTAYSHSDPHPDIFSFNFLGYSGKFFLNHKGEWKVQCDFPLKVEFNPVDLKHNLDLVTGTLPCFTQFTLIDAQGIRFVFGGENAIEYSSSTIPHLLNYSKGWIASSWFLKEILTPSGEMIRFNYERGPFQSHFSYFDLPYAVYPRKNLTGDELYEAHNYVYNNSNYSVISGTIISPVYLIKIEHPKRNLTISFKSSKSNELAYYETTYTDPYLKSPFNPGPIPVGYLSFSPTTNIPYFDRNPADKIKAQQPSTFKDRFVWLKLDEISFNYPQQSKKIQFYYQEKSNKRLKLDSISIIYPDATQRETYGFEYNQHLAYTHNKEYEYLSEFGDHWGFTNGFFLWDIKSYDRNNIFVKQPTRDRAKFGILSKITYPTKGFTQLFFENHEYAAYSKYDQWPPSLVDYQSLGMAGGLRIKKIVNVDGQGLYTSKEYVYKSTNYPFDTGILRSKAGYLLFNGETAAHLFSGNGAHIGYSSVIEKYEDGSFKASTFTCERYQNRLNETVPGILDDIPVWAWLGRENYVPHSRRDFERGKLLDEYYCNPNNKIIKSRHLSYINIKRDSSNFIRSYDPYTYWYYSGKYPIYDVDSESTNSRIAYYQYSYPNCLKSIRELSYVGSDLRYGEAIDPKSNGIIMSEQNFYHDDYGQVIKESFSLNSGKLVYSTIKYPYTDPSGSAILTEMKNRHMMSYPIEKRTYLENTLLGGLNYNYDYFYHNQILLSSLAKVNKDGSSNIQYQNKYDGGRLIEQKEYTGLVKSYLWDNGGKNLLAIVNNASLDDIKIKLPNIVLTGGKLSQNYLSEIQSLRTGLPKATVQSYDYLFNGLINSETNPTGLTTYYDYDKNDRLQTIKNHQQQVINKFEYHRRESSSTPGIHLNDFMALTTSKQCPTGYVSNKTFDYEVSEGMVVSTISKADANALAVQKYTLEAQKIADKSCECIPFGTYTLINNIYWTVVMHNCYYQDNIISMSVILSCDDVTKFSDYDWYNAGIRVGNLQGNKFPTTINYVEFKDDRKNKINTIGNTWILWIDSSGQVYMKLKSGDIDQKPLNSEHIYFNAEIPMY